MKIISFRRFLIDQFLNSFPFYGKVIDIGGKKDNKRGGFNPKMQKVEEWVYVNIDISVNPDICSSTESIPVTNNSYDNALLIEVLEHLENPVSVLKEISRILKNNGKLILTIPFLYPVHADPYDFQRWTPDKIRNELCRLGFQDIKIQNLGNLLVVIFDLIMFINRRSIFNKQTRIKILINKILRKLARLICYFDKYFVSYSQYITSGYFVEAKKSNLKYD